ncbi:MAG: hypothetical protein ACTSWQ_10970 [Candidatus Thorarchaeota archaeon]
MLALLLQFSFLDLSISQWALVGWVLGALYSLLLPFYFKVRAGDLDYSEFNFGYIVNFLITLITGVAISLLVFATWTIPEGSWFIILLVAFMTAAGFDQELIIKVLNAIGLYEAVWNKTNG